MSAVGRPPSVAKTKSGTSGFILPGEFKIEVQISEFVRNKKVSYRLGKRIS